MKLLRSMKLFVPNIFDRLIHLAPNISQMPTVCIKIHCPIMLRLLVSLCSTINTPTRSLNSHDETYTDDDGALVFHVSTTLFNTAEALVSDPRNQPLLNSQNKSCNMQCLFTFETERARLRCSTRPCSSFRLCCCSFGIGRCFRCHFFHNKAKLTRCLRAQDSFTFTALKQKTF